MTGRRIDLHAHTNVSDGTLAPRALVELAHRQGLAALAVTDHDHVGGLAEAREAGERLGVEVVPGIELSVDHPEGELHLLGYLFDPQDTALAAALELFRAAREARGQRIVERLQELGVEITMEEVERVVGAHGASVGRPHIARALLEKRIVASISEAFDRWLAEGRPAYVARKRLDARQSIELVHRAGGVAVLAHPGLLKEERRVGIVRELAALGLDGVEVEYSRHSAEDRRRFAALAQELGLVATGGSDFHGDNKPDVELGSGVHRNVHVDYAVLDALRARQASRVTPRASSSAPR